MENNLTAALTAAYFKVQELDFIKKSDGFKNAYKFMTLQEIKELINPIYKEIQVRIVQAVSAESIDGNVFITCTTSFIGMGEKEEYTGRMPFEKMPGMNTPQSSGSHYTYFKRYHLCGLLGIIPEEDNDGDHKTHKGYKPQAKNTPQGADKQPSQPQNGEVIPNDQQVIEAINSSVLVQSKKESLITQYRSKSEHLKGSFYKGCILPQIGRNS